jgi:superfamily II RNA helicase
VINEPRLRDNQAEEMDAVNVIDRIMEFIIPTRLSDEEKTRCTEALWASMDDAAAIERATCRMEQLREDVWQPFAQRARVLAALGYLDFEAEKVTDRGRWLADLHIDRPLIVGEALEQGVLASVGATRMAAVMAALTADEDRDYGELELEDSIVTTLAQFEELGFRIATEEWRFGIEPEPELNFSAAGAAALWANGVEWKALVQKTRAEEGDLFRMLSRTGESLLQVAGLRRVHREAAKTAAEAAANVLREPVR